jgi:4-amino-4-deoxy-L-arabinose transferase-like glycosyltransferase
VSAHQCPPLEIFGRTQTIVLAIVFLAAFLRVHCLARGQSVNDSKRIAILLVVFVALALFYSLIIPLFEGPDEDDHFRYAKFIADHRALPVQLFEPGGGAAGHQGWQPPLYYSLAAALIAPIDTSDYEEHLWRNYAATFVGDPACCGRNIYYHTDSENFPYTRTTLAVHLARLLSIFFGGVTVWATYKLACTLFPEKGDLALAAAAVVAFNPSFLFISALVSNDAALAAFSSLILLTWARWLRAPTAPALHSTALLGALIALALLTKTTALGLFPLTCLLLAFLTFQRRRGNAQGWLRDAATHICLLTFAFLLLSGWWLARNAVLYGDPLALRLVQASALFPRAGPLTPSELFQISLPWLWQTFWGGPTPGDFSPAILVALAALTALAFVGVVTRFHRIRNSEFRIPIFFLAAWLGFILASQFQFIQMTTGADQGRYLFPAVSVIALIFVFGLTELLGRTTKDEGQKPSVIRLSSFVILVAFFALALFVPFAYTLPAYARPALLSENDLARAAHRLDIVFADQIELRGYDLETRAAKPGSTLRLALYWRARATMNESYRVFAHLVGQENRVAGGADVIPARGAFPTVYWKPGDILRDVIQIPIAEDALPGKYAIQVGLYPVGKPGERLPMTPSGDERAMVDAIKIAPREPPTYAPQTRMDANFAGAARLIGYDVRAESNSLALVLYWQAVAPMNRDYTVFVHAIGKDGSIIAQADRQPQEGNYPTSLWDVGEQIRDEYALPVSAADVQIILGLYDAETGRRLPILDERGAAQGDIVTLVVK